MLTAPVVLGGDHYIAYPSVKGFCEGMKKRLGRKPKVGLIHIDSHLDAYNENDTWGKYYHGSPSRRISELDSVDMHNMVYVGINGTVGVEPYEYLIGNGATIYTIEDVNKDGPTKIIKKAAAIAGNDTDVIYCTIDIDVVDQAYSIGTGSYIYGGITSVQLLEMASALSEENIGAIDIVEVSPPLDPSGNTSRLAATTLLNFLKPRLFEYR
jgi:agmatinase